MGTGVFSTCGAVEAVIARGAWWLQCPCGHWGLFYWDHSENPFDFDYEMHETAPAHPVEGEKILAEQGWPEHIRRAVLSHADYTGVTRESTMEKALHACDDITGLIVAVALVRPDKDIRNVKVKSIRKKWKNGKLLSKD